jgi:hypothetical protein
MSQITLDQLSPEVLALLQQQGVQTPGSRSPIRKPLMDLREPSSPKDRINRPQFHWSADPDEAGKRPYKYSPYPKLLWNADGREVLVKDAAAERALGDGWYDTPQFAPVDNVVDELTAELSLLTAEERMMVMDAQRQARLSRLQAKLDQLSEDELAQVVGESASGAGDVASPPVKRGRPKKSADGHSA